MYSIYVDLKDKRGVKDAEVAKATGITKSTFTDWKNGRSEPGIKKLQKIADYFNVSVEYLMTGKESTYYMNDETANIAQAVFDDPDLRLLFDAARNVKPENIRLAAEMLKRFKETNDG